MDKRRWRDSVYRDFFTKGSGKITITGQLGDVMKESAQIAITLVKTSSDKADVFKENDLHIHVPSGAVPKTVLPQVSHW